jgi:hypothetical protein
MVPPVICCPNCQVRLRLPAVVPGATYTCPRCLAAITPEPSGAAAITAAPPTGEQAIQASAPAGAEWQGITGEPSERLWSADGDVRRDTQGTGCGGLVLVLLLGLGTVLAGLGAKTAGPRERYFPGRAMMAGSVVGLVLAAIVFVRTTVAGMRRVQEAQSAGVLSQIIVGIVFAVLAAGAAFVVFFVTCWAGIVGGTATEGWR